MSSQSQFTIPTIHSFPPFFTLQRHEETLSRQLSLWSSLILSYCQHNHTFHLTDSLDIFTNASINRVIHPNLYKAITSQMLATKKLIRNSKGTLLVWYKSPSEWSSLLHNYAIKTGNTSGAIMTMYELMEGEDSVGEEFHALPEDIWRLVLVELEREGKARVFGQETAQNSTEIGIKFA